MSGLITIILWAILFAIFVVPIILTIINLIILFKPETRLKRTTATAVTVIYGALLSLLAMAFINLIKWTGPIIYSDHSVSYRLSPDFLSMLWLLTSFIGVISILNLNREQILLPKTAVLCINGIYAWIIFKIICLLQLWYIVGIDFHSSQEDKLISITELYLYLYCFNCIICSFSTIRATIQRYRAYYRDNNIQVDNMLDWHIRNILENNGFCIFQPLAVIVAVFGTLATVALLCSTLLK